MRTRLIALSLSLAALAGCSSTKLTETPPVAGATAAKPAPAPQPAQPARTAQSTVSTVTVHPLDDPKSGLARRSVFFEFDSALIADAERPVIEAHAKYLAGSKTARMRIEGNCDERGGREYNLALGQRRAESVRKSLQLLGVPDGEMEATSYGKEKPVDAGHDESAWAKNRRADLNYLAR